MGADHGRLAGMKSGQPFDRSATDIGAEPRCPAHHASAARWTASVRRSPQSRQPQAASQKVRSRKHIMPAHYPSYQAERAQHRHRGPDEALRASSLSLPIRPIPVLRATPHGEAIRERLTGACR